MVKKILILIILDRAAKDLIIGGSFTARLIHSERAQYNAFKKRVKEFFYSDPGQKIIKGIIARDIGQLAATVTAGKVGSDFVNLRLRSERGSGFHYNIELYA